MYGDEPTPCDKCFPIDLMPENERALEAFLHCLGQVKREWTTDEGQRVYRAFDIDHTGVYCTLSGLSAMDVFPSVLSCLSACLADGVLS